MSQPQRIQEIGYVCGRGHFCFYDDPEEDGACSGKRIAGVYVKADDELEFRAPAEHDCGYSVHDYQQGVDEARASLATHLEGGS